MTLLIKPNCPNCPEGLLDRVYQAGGTVLKVVQHPDGTPHIQMEENKFMPLPANIPGLPALLMSDKVYVGGAVIQELLK